ncbi:MAG: hypothetical protein QY306_05280 [Anaerolineales bacterium]|nr:MAG: hypothetical protein QY306_05280 [Anaerolineales bacterium]
MNTSENSLVIGGNSVPNGADFSIRLGASYSYVVDGGKFWWAK